MNDSNFQVGHGQTSQISNGVPFKTKYNGNNKVVRTYSNESCAKQVKIPLLVL